MTQERDWKRLYEELLQQHESQLATETELGKLLSHTIIRLTLAASGLDSQLDPHLKGIRDAVRGGVTPSIKEKLNSLSDSLIHFSEDVETDRNLVERLSQQLASRIQLSMQDKTELIRLLNMLLSPSGQMSDDALDRLAELLSPGENQLTGHKAGLLGRLFPARSAAADGTVNSTNHILLNLLEQASWPGHWSAEIAQLKARLSGKPADNEWVAVLEALLDLSARSYGEAKAEIKEAEDFLGELTLRLQDLDAHLRQAHDGRSEVVKHGQALSDEVTTQVGGLYTSVSAATDLDQLKQDVRNRLNGIQQAMEVFLTEEERWFQSADSDEQQLRERLDKLEQESEDLRYRLLEAHHLALLDAVTGLPNRLAYDERVAQEYARWKRFAEPLSMLVWDVDNFKSINDRFGHQAGDRALKVIAASLKKRVRETDFIARYGGEEFVTLLCGANQDEALQVAEEMRQSVMQCAFHSGNKAVPVTISCGLSHFIEGDQVEDVFKRADAALYQAKRKGKNCCELA
ncbi:MAG: GGDEF domain-containing protein [Gammaproteobacteria bacterium]|nr:GGDEF domain-containing protein [Gammaproteobacteria bacterium]